VNLNCIKTLRDRYKRDVGTAGTRLVWWLLCAAAALGVTSLERHITLNRAMYGLDQTASVEPAGFRQLAGAVRKIEKAMEDGKRVMNDKEIPIAEKLRAHVPVELH